MAPPKPKRYSKKYTREIPKNNYKKPFTHVVRTAMEKARYGVVEYFYQFVEENIDLAKVLCKLAEVEHVDVVDFTENISVFVPQYSYV